MKKAGCSEVEIDRICACIEATKLPQNPNDMYAEVLCDADFFHLGTSNFLYRNLLLRKEWELFCNIVMTDEERQLFNIKFLEGRQFKTDYGKDVLENESNLFGKDVMKMGKSDERAFIGNYRKLGLLKGSELMVLGDQKQANFYQWKSMDNSLQSMPINDAFLKETISYFQVADYLYSNNGLTLKASN